ncbi:hypothetical protein ACHWQZ_G017009 [Mnemiopsis leidyi]
MPVSAPPGSIRRKVSFTEDTLIEHAIKSEDVAELSGMLGRQGSLSPNSIVLQGESPLHVSVRKDRIHSTKVLLDQGADVNLQDEDGQTPLHYAIANDNLELAALLIDAGGDLFRLDDHGILPTALFKSSSMKSFLNDKIFEHSLSNLSKVLNKSDEDDQSSGMKMGYRRLSDTDLTVMQTNQKRRIRSRTLSDSGVHSKPRSILKKTSAYAPRVSIVCEGKESLESLMSFGQQQEEKRQKMLSDEQEEQEEGEERRTVSCTPTVRNHKDRRGNFIVRAIWSTRNKLKLIKR